MSANSRLHVVLCWNMHQPEYRDLASGNYQLPWTYLHAIKDYVDMAAHLEQVPAARAVFNFAPVLLDHLADYAAQIDAYLKDAVALRDPLLAALDSPALPVRDAERLTLIKACLRANRTRMIEAIPVFRCLAHMAAWLDQDREAAHYFSEQYLADLVVWYHLAWMGETVRRRGARIERLITKGSGFSLHDHRERRRRAGQYPARRRYRTRQPARADAVPALPIRRQRRHRLFLSRRCALRSDRFQVRHLARRRRRRQSRAATREHRLRRRRRRALSRPYHPRRRKCVGILSQQRLLFFERALQKAGGAPAHRAHHLFGLSRAASAPRPPAAPGRRQLGVRHLLHLDRRQG